MKYALFFAGLASGCIGLQAQAQFITFAPTDEMTLTGKIQGSAKVSAPYDPANCPLDYNVSTPEPFTPSTVVPLWPAGDAGSRTGLAIVDNACPGGYADSSVRFGMVLDGTASTSHLSVNYASSGQLAGSATSPIPPCGLPGPTTASYEAFVSHGTSVYQVNIPFTVTTECFAIVDVSIFHGLGETSGALQADWSFGPCGSDSVAAHSGQTLDVDFVQCCVQPGDYELNVTLWGFHAVSGGANCFNMPTDSDNEFVEVGFALNVQFQDYCSCPGDVNNDGVVDVDDYIAVIIGWGPCPPSATPCSGDADHDGDVDVDDQILVTLSWGECECCLE